MICWKDNFHIKILKIICNPWFFQKYDSLEKLGIIEQSSFETNELILFNLSYKWSIQIVRNFECNCFEIHEKYQENDKTNQNTIKPITKPITQHP